MKSFIKKHKKLVIVGVVCLTLAILLFVAVFGVFFSNSSRGSFGNRLNNAEVVENAVINDIKTDLQSKNFVKTVDYIMNVRILRFFIHVEDGTKLEDAQALADVISEKLGSRVTSYYDVEVFLTTEGESNDYPAIGYLFKTSSKFSWSRGAEWKTEKN